MEEIRKIAIKAPLEFPFDAFWSDTSITNELPLYSVDGEMFAYCFDIVNDRTRDTAHLIVGMDDGESPVIQYVPYSVSPYSTLTLTRGQKAVYVSAGAYYLDTGENIVSLDTNETISKAAMADELSAGVAKTESLSAAAKNKNRAHREYLLQTSADQIIAGSSTRAQTKISGVPNYQWYRGCVPTVAAMLLHYHYSYLRNNVTSTALINLLAVKMCTTSGGATIPSNVAAGIYDTISFYGLTMTTCDYQAEDLLGIPLCGITYNPYYLYKNEINAGYPTMIYVRNCQYPSPVGFTGGFGTHQLLGIGYMESVNNLYLIVHTTSTADGEVFIDTSSSLWTGWAWQYFRP